MAYKRPAKEHSPMIRPINMILRHLQNQTRVQICLVNNGRMRIEGVILGFDVYLNVVLNDAEEVYMDTNERKPVGRILLKGDNITLIQIAASNPNMPTSTSENSQK